MKFKPQVSKILSGGVTAETVEGFHTQFRLSSCLRRERGRKGGGGGDSGCCSSRTRRDVVFL